MAGQVNLLVRARGVAGGETAAQTEARVRLALEATKEHEEDLCGRGASIGARLRRRAPFPGSLPASRPTPPRRDAPLSAFAPRGSFCPLGPMVAVGATFYALSFRNIISNGYCLLHTGNTTGTVLKG